MKFGIKNNVNDFCELNSNLDDNTDNYEEKKDNAKITYKVLMSIFICTNAISIATAIFLLINIIIRISLCHLLNQK